jgi:hypothetical protein
MCEIYKVHAYYSLGTSRRKWKLDWWLLSDIRMPHGHTKAVNVHNILETVIFFYDESPIVF